MAGRSNYSLILYSGQLGVSGQHLQLPFLCPLPWANELYKPLNLFIFVFQLPKESQFHLTLTGPGVRVEHFSISGLPKQKFKGHSSHLFTPSLQQLSNLWPTKLCIKGPTTSALRHLRWLLLSFKISRAKKLLITKCQKVISRSCAVCSSQW